MSSSKWLQFGRGLNVIISDYMTDVHVTVGKFHNRCVWRNVKIAMENMQQFLWVFFFNIYHKFLIFFYQDLQHSYKTCVITLPIHHVAFKIQ